MRPPVRVLPTLVVAALSLTGCAAGTPGTEAAPAGTLKVMASFYPLQYVAEQVGGDLVTVQSLTPPGTEPHDVELAPASVAALEGSSAVVYASGFQPAVDDAIQQARPQNVVDVSAGTADPHFWLDPERLAEAARRVADKLAEADPEKADTFAANARSLTARLHALDRELRQGLAHCRSRTVVASHEAYGHLTNKYGLKQVGISGLDPDTEPSPARIADIARVVRDENVTTVFTESLVNPKVAETLASDLGVSTAVLDPLEGLSDESSDYESIMRQNLRTLRSALDCT